MLNGPDDDRGPWPAALDALDNRVAGTPGGFWHLACRKVPSRQPPIWERRCVHWRSGSVRLKAANAMQRMLGHAGRFMIISGYLLGTCPGRFLPTVPNSAQQCPPVEPPSQRKISAGINSRQ